MARAKRKDIDDIENDEEETGKVTPITKKQQDKERGEVMEKVRNFVERIEECNSDIDDARSAKAIVMKEAVDMGLDRKILNKIVKLRKESATELEDELEKTKLYAEAVQLKLPGLF